MALPLTRNTTYGAASPIRSYDLNDLQDQIIILNTALLAATATLAANGAHGDRVRNISPYSIIAANGVAIVYGTGPANATLGTGSQNVLSIPMLQGDRLKSITFARKGTSPGTADISALELRRTTAAGVDTLLINTTDDNIAFAAFVDKTIDPADTLIAAGDSISLTFWTTGTGIMIGNIRVLYDRP